MTTTRLTKEQRHALECLRRNKGWAGEWIIGGVTRTRRILGELERAGLAARKQGANQLGAYTYFVTVEEERGLRTLLDAAVVKPT